MTPLFDAAANSGALQSVSSATFSHTCTGSNLILIVAIGGRQSLASKGNLVITGVTYNGVALTKIRADEIDSDASFRTELWYLIAPATGAHNVVVTYTGSIIYGGCVSSSYTLVEQSAGALDAQGTAQNDSSTTLSANITNIATSSIIIDAVYSRSGTLTKNAAQSLNGGITINSDDNVGSSRKSVSSAGADTMDWTESNDGNSWVMSLVSIRSPLEINVSDSPTVTESVTVSEISSGVKLVDVSDSPTVTDALTIQENKFLLSVSDSPIITESVSLLEVAGGASSLVINGTGLSLTSGHIYRLKISLRSNLNESVLVAMKTSASGSQGFSKYYTLTADRWKNISTKFTALSTDANSKIVITPTLSIQNFYIDGAILNDLTEKTASYRVMRIQGFLQGSLFTQKLYLREVTANESD